MEFGFYKLVVIRKIPEYCPLPCSERIVKSKVETTRLYDIVRVHKYGTGSSFQFKFLSKRQTEVHEVPTYTSDNFFSDVGSWLGLLVGMSCLSIVEVVAFVYSLIKEKWCSL